MKHDDIKPGLSVEEWERRCMHYAEDAFYTPPDAFLFRHYDEKTVLKCERGVLGGNYFGDMYFVHGHDAPGYYGAYTTRDVAYYLKSGTWVEVPSASYFADRKVQELRKALEQAEAELSSITGCPPHDNQFRND